MGGMIDTSKTDWPPVLETNLNADPGAAEIVFAAGLPLTLVPVEVTTQVFLTPEQRAALRSWKHPLAGTLVTLMEEMLARFAHFAEEQSLPNDLFAGRTFMHDPLAVYTAIATRLVTVRRTCVQLEVHDRVLRTIAYPDRRANVWVCVDVDAPGLVGYWLDSIKGLATA